MHFASLWFNFIALKVRFYSLYILHPTICFEFTHNLHPFDDFLLNLTVTVSQNHRRGSNCEGTQNCGMQSV